jgi:soluble calcium-activated nucleotidase 1
MWWLLEWLLGTSTVAAQTCTGLCPQHPLTVGPPPVPKSGADYYQQVVAPQVLTVDRTLLTFAESEYPFYLVADMDLKSRDPQKFLWRSYLKYGRIRRKNSKNERPAFEVDFLKEDVLHSHTATKNRSMELSELVVFNRLTLAFCDFSGIVYKIGLNDPRPNYVNGAGEDEPGIAVFQRWALADGDGNQAKPFKTEWATIKDGSLWVGSIGFEWYKPDGTILHRNAEWVKVVDESGSVQNVNWHPVYQAIRTATNTTLPGFLWHEAVEWEPLTRRWLLMPRFGSTKEKYKPGGEVGNTMNVLIVADEFFTDIRVLHMPHHDPDYGFTSLRKIPGSQLFAAIRVSETEEGDHFTQIGIFDLNGEFYTDPPYIDVGARKFEGLAFPMV